MAPNQGVEILQRVNLRGHEMIIGGVNKKKLKKEIVTQSQLLCWTSSTL